jgi:hypothetical protein
MTEEEDQYMDLAAAGRRRLGNGVTDGRKIEIPAFYCRHKAMLAREPYPTDC